MCNHILCMPIEQQRLKLNPNNSRIRAMNHGLLGLIIYYDSTRLAVYNGVTHDPQNPSVVETMCFGHDFHISSSGGYD